MRRDRDCGRFGKSCDELSRRVCSSRASVQTRISSSWVQAYESKSGAVISRSRLHNHLPWTYKVICDSSRWRSNCCERPIEATSGISEAERTCSVNESIEVADQISSNVDRDTPCILQRVSSSMPCYSDVTQSGCLWWVWTFSEIRISAFCMNIIFNQKFRLRGDFWRLIVEWWSCWDPPPNRISGG